MTQPWAEPQPRSGTQCHAPAAAVSRCDSPVNSLSALALGTDLLHPICLLSVLSLVMSSELKGCPGLKNLFFPGPTRHPCGGASRMEFKP